MHEVTPEVYIVAETQTRTGPIYQMLNDLGSKEYKLPAVPAAEQLVEIGGRLCYKSFEVGLNPNVTKVREGNKDYIHNILKQKHGSVLEHASTTVIMLNVSRILTHEYVRHRAGAAFSQESMRFVRLDDIGMYIPDCIKEDAEATQIFVDAVEYAEAAYRKLVALKITDDMPFHKKKTLTSAFRRIASAGHATNIMGTGNHRAWRHMIEQRTSPGAEEEIVKVFMLIAQHFQVLYPALYQDMISITHEDNLNLRHYSFCNSKI